MLWERAGWRFMSRHDHPHSHLSKMDGTCPLLGEGGVAPSHACCYQLDRQVDQGCVAQPACLPSFPLAHFFTSLPACTLTFGSTPSGREACSCNASLLRGGGKGGEAGGQRLGRCPCPLHHITEPGRWGRPLPLSSLPSLTARRCFSKEQLHGVPEGEGNTAELPAMPP